MGTSDLSVPQIPTGEGELGVTRQAATASQEIQAAVFLAKKFPRNEEQAFSKIMSACQRYSFADNVTYVFPRGGKQVSGPAVYLAREMARVWGNMRYGAVFIAEEEEKLVGEAFAWDLETNTWAIAQFKVPKLQQRKDRESGITKWVIPDERDLRELFNNFAARNYRNCILSLMPPDYVNAAVEMADKTVEAKVKEDPDAALKKMLTSFAQLHIAADDLARYLGHPVSQSDPAELATLRQIWKAIMQGEAKWADYAQPDTQKSTGSINLNSLKPSQSENRGHDAVQVSPLSQANSCGGDERADPPPAPSENSAGLASHREAGASKPGGGNGASTAKVPKIPPVVQAAAANVVKTLKLNYLNDAWVLAGRHCIDDYDMNPQTTKEAAASNPDIGCFFTILLLLGMQDTVKLSTWLMEQNLQWSTFYTYLQKDGKELTNKFVAKQAANAIATMDHDSILTSIAPREQAMEQGELI